MTANLAIEETWSLSGALLELAECGESEMVADILNVFADDTEAKIATLRELINDSNFHGIGRIAHSLKGAARQIGLDDMASAAEKLERGVAAADFNFASELVSVLAHRWTEAKRAIDAVRNSF